MAPLELVLPHHAFYRAVGLATVLGICLLVVLDLDLSVNGEVDQLSNGHAAVDLYRLLNRDLQCPVAAESNIALAGGSMDVDTQSTGGRLSFKEGYVRMCFGVFLGNAQVEYMGIKDKSFFRDLEMFNLVVLLCIQDMLPVGSQETAQVNIIAVATQTIAAVRLDLDGAFSISSRMRVSERIMNHSDFDGCIAIFDGTVAFAKQVSCRLSIAAN